MIAVRYAAEKQYRRVTRKDGRGKDVAEVEERRLKCFAAESVRKDVETERGPGCGLLAVLALGLWLAKEDGRGWQGLRRTKQS